LFLSIVLVRATPALRRHLAEQQEWRVADELLDRCDRALFAHHRRQCH
jgi:hypothetical protein